jgi:hypothetical protein
MFNPMVASGIKSNSSKSKSYITREEALSMFVTAYEAKEGSEVKVNSYLLNIINKNRSISNTYKRNIAKAYSLNLISDINNLRPKEALKYGEMFAIWSKIENL